MWTARALPFAVIAAAVAATPASAAVVNKFTRAGFDAAQAQNKSILVDVKAWWCPICASQNATIKSAVADAAYDKLVIFEVDYDEQKPDWKRFDVTKQGTLIAFRGKREIGRLAFVTDKTAINDLLAQSVRP